MSGFLWAWLLVFIGIIFLGFLYIFNFFSPWDFLFLMSLDLSFEAFGTRIFFRKIASRRCGPYPVDHEITGAPFDELRAGR